MGTTHHLDGDIQRFEILNESVIPIFAFVTALGDVGSDWAGAAAGCVNWGFPTLADTDIPEVLPTGICTYEHVVANVPHDELVQKSVEVRGLKVTVSDIDIPLSFGPAYEGERVRGSDLYCQMGGGKSQCTELVQPGPFAATHQDGFGVQRRKRLEGGGQLVSHRG